MPMNVSKVLSRPPNQWENGVYVISNSEVSSFLACEKRHAFAFLYNGHGLEPVKFSTALSRGVIGHQALNEFYDSLRNGKSIEEARQAMIMSVHEVAMDIGADLEMLTELLSLLKDYVDYYGESDKKDWEILAVEKYYDVPLTEQFKFGMRLDLLVRSKQTGEVTVVDHKFVYDFYTANQLLIDAQLPKYIATVQANGITVHKGVINQLRHRTRKTPMEMTDKFRRDYQVYTVNTKEIRNIMRDQIIVSGRIVERREMDWHEADNLAVRNIAKMNCDTCAFLQICKSQLQGEPITTAVETNYRPNSYGYREESNDK